MAKNEFTIEWKRGKSPKAFAGKLELFKSVLDKRLEAAMQDAVHMVERDAKGRAPVDTGNLKASIASEVKGDVDGAVEGYVGTPVEYGFFQEFGTSKMGASPFLQPAVDANRGNIIDRFERAVDEAAIAVGLR